MNASDLFQNTTMKIVGSGNNTACDAVMVELFKDSPFFDGAVTPLPDRLLVFTRT